RIAGAKVVAVEAFTRNPHAVAAADGDLDRQFLVEQTAVAVQALQIDHRGHDAPEAAAAAAVVRENGKATDETAAALYEIDGAGKNQFARVAGAQGGLALRFVLAVVQSQCLLVAVDGVNKADNEIGCGGYHP